MIWAFVAGAAMMCVLCLGMAWGLTILLARVNGSVARVLSDSVGEALRGIFQPPSQELPEGRDSVEEDPEPTHGPQGLWYQDEKVPAWEEESMDPLEPSEVSPVSYEGVRQFFTHEPLVDLQ